MPKVLKSNIKNISKRESTAFDASSTKRRTRDWFPGNSCPNTLNSNNLLLIRSRSRALSRNLSIVDGAYNTLTANIIGDGFVPDVNLGNDKFKTQALEVWKNWSYEADADGVLDLTGLSLLALRERYEAGEVFVRIRQRRSSDGLFLPIQLQLLESEYVPVTKNETLPSGNRIINGIEFNRFGKRVAYYVYSEHPGNTTSPSIELKRISADKIIHCYKPLRAGQVRALPLGTPAFLKIRDWSIYDESELIRQQIASLFTGYITRNTSGDEASPLNEDLFDQEAEDGVGVTKLEPGIIQLLDYGENIVFSKPPDAGNNYDKYAKSVLRTIASAFNLTYEQLTQDLSDVNFSSIRAGLNEFQRKAKIEQKHTAFQFYRPVWKAVLEEAILQGKIRATDYLENPYKYINIPWMTPGWRYVNPQQEVQADIMAVGAGFKSRKQVAAERGDDVNIIDQQNHEDLKRAESLGLEYSPKLPQQADDNLKTDK